MLIYSFRGKCHLLGLLQVIENYNVLFQELMMPSSDVRQQVVPSRARQPWTVSVWFHRSADTLLRVVVVIMRRSTLMLAS
ncbi:hypothetical protein E2C01_010170 [Portunus trituberculatus]|uniref:Uncharacterized protein n=1 Tax=Portunus trituberculatus TaxID=210409 RepID=A0A5B7D7Q7_PORTR|nr:hypothetical protein [Portunus trituberculatus]